VRTADFRPAVARRHDFQIAAETDPFQMVHARPAETDQSNPHGWANRWRCHFEKVSAPVVTALDWLVRGGSQPSSAAANPCRTLRRAL
jgi:hypothetical protein